MEHPFGPPCQSSPGVARLTRYVPHAPTPAQRVFLQLNCLEAFYGGAAGGGKSDALLMAGLQFVDVPGYAGLILRKTYADLNLPGALLDRAKAWLSPTDAKYQAAMHTYVFPSGATLTFGYADAVGDEMRYQGAELQFVAFDEVTQFTESVYRFLFSRIRRPQRADSYPPSADGLTLNAVPLRMRSASNPGGVGHDWVKKRLVDAKSREPGAVFVPSQLEDNPHLDQEGYDRGLAMLDPVTYARLRGGDWSVKPAGAVFDASKIVVVEERWPEASHIQRVRYWDLASTELRKDGNDPDETVGVRLAHDTKTGLLLIEDVLAIREEPHVIEKWMQRIAALDGKKVPIVVEQEPGASGKNFISNLRRHILSGYSVDGDRPSGPKELRIRLIAPTVNNGEMSVVRGKYLTALLDQVDSYNPLYSKHDDQVDALAGAVGILWSKRRNSVLVGPSGVAQESYWKRGG